MPIRKNKISYKIDLTKQLKRVPKKDKKKAATVFAEALRDGIVDYCEKQRSPVSGFGAFQKLSSEYKKTKLAAGEPPVPNLWLAGNMLPSIEAVGTQSSAEIKITDRLQKLKSYNHNVGDTLPQRPFIPDDENDGKFKASILKRAREAIKKFEAPQKKPARKKQDDRPRQRLSELRAAIESIELEDIT